MKKILMFSATSIFMFIVNAAYAGTFFGFQGSFTELPDINNAKIQYSYEEHGEQMDVDTVFKQKSNLGGSVVFGGYVGIKQLGYLGGELRLGSSSSIKAQVNVKHRPTNLQRKLYDTTTVPIPDIKLLAGVKRHIFYDIYVTGKAGLAVGTVISNKNNNTDVDLTWGFKTAPTVGASLEYALLPGITLTSNILYSHNLVEINDTAANKSTKISPVSFDLGVGIGW